MSVKINVTKPVAIPNNNQRSVDLKAGVHEIEEAYLDHWYVKALMKQGIITIVKSGPKVAFKPLPVAEEKKASPIIENYRPVIGKVTLNVVEEKPEEVVEVIIPSNKKDIAPKIDEVVVEVKEVEPVKVIKRRQK